ncbi:hypothetical protein [Gordonia sp. i37]|uniref:hypothetical protein n=1 Tax=Gordonia sp. i37 TaxID=1961707 RepID=UPI0009CE8EBB|nr:hypothetical protein [Gordonia sp. i37]OPX14379.1 hypothetical protein B1964_15475 [Gordonia sp. i37]
MTSITAQRYCAYTWCSIADHPNHDEHFDDVYVHASQSGPYRTTLTVGAGVMLVDGDDAPSIYVHIQDDVRIDEDAYMTVNEAMDLVDALIGAITHARSVTS